MTTETPLAWITFESSETEVFHLKPFFDATAPLCFQRHVVFNRTIEYAESKGWRCCRRCAKKAPKFGIQPPTP